MITIPVTSVWLMQTPVVYRCMDRNSVDKFFEDGELRLSSTSNFRSHPDEKLKDGLEGIYSIVGHHKPTGTHFNGILESAYYSYILCGTTHRSPVVVHKFGSNAAIQIFDTTAFGVEIGKQIAGLRKGAEGFCIYNDGPIEFMLPDDISPDIAMLHAEKFDTDDLCKFTCGRETNQSSAHYFKKHPRFEHESEYLWIWSTNKIANGELFIKAPDARQYCRPIYFDV